MNTTWTRRLGLLAALWMIGCGEAMPPEVHPESPIDEVRASWGRSSLLLAFRGSFEVAPRTGHADVSVDLFDEDDRLIGTHHDTHLWLGGRSDGEPRITPARISFPVDTRPHTVFVRVTLQFLPGVGPDAPIFSQRLGFIPDVPVVEGECDPHGFANRCPDGQGCAYPNMHLPVLNFEAWPGGEGGRCTPMSVHAWSTDPDAAAFGVLDIRADDPIETSSIGVRLVPHREGVDVRMQRTDRDAENGPAGFRALELLFGRVGEGRIDPGPFDVYVGPHLLGEAVEVVPPAQRAAGDACDPWGIADRCAAGTRCSAAGLCEAAR